MKSYSKTTRTISIVVLKEEIIKNCFHYNYHFMLQKLKKKTCESDSSFMTHDQEGLHNQAINHFMISDSENLTIKQTLTSFHNTNQYFPRTETIKSVYRTNPRTGSE